MGSYKVSLILLYNQGTAIHSQVSVHFILTEMEAKQERLGILI